MSVGERHKKNHDILVKAGFEIITYGNTANSLVLVARHKDGRKVNIEV